MVTDNPVTNDPRYLNLFECGKNLFNNLDANCEQSCMANPKDKYHTDMCNTLSDHNDRSNTPSSNANIREAMRKFMEKESIMDAKNITADTFSHASNAQG